MNVAKKTSVELFPLAPKELTVLQGIIPQLFDQVASALESPIKVGDIHLVTLADLRINKLVTRKIGSEFPKDSILSEESPFKGELNDTHRLWVIDPICGSFNLAQGRPICCTNIALVEEGGLVFGLVVDYLRKTYYWASKENAGVWDANNKQISAKIDAGLRNQINFDSGKLRLKGSKQDNKRWGGIIDELYQNNFDFLSVGSSLSWAEAGMGRGCGSLVVGSTNPWDAAAAVYFFQKNQGVATDFMGMPWKIDSPTLVASLDLTLHHEVLQIIQKC